VRSRPDAGMVLEHALLPVRPGREADFEAAFAVARSLIAASPGFRGCRCRAASSGRARTCCWSSGSASRTTPGASAGSAAYQRWRELLHGFYDPFPTVEHFREVLTASPPDGAAEPEGPRHPIGSSRTSGGASSDSGSR
jgi:hypothetical protein